MVLVDRRFVIIHIGRHTVFHIKEIVGIAVHLRLWRGSKPHQNPIKIIKNRAVFLKNTAVTFVNDDEVKVCRRKELAPLALGIIDDVQDCRIGGKDNARVAVVLVVAQIAKAHVRQIIFEVVLGLLHQGGAVCQK